MRRETSLVSFLSVLCPRAVNDGDNSSALARDLGELAHLYKPVSFVTQATSNLSRVALS